MHEAAWKELGASVAAAAPSAGAAGGATALELRSAVVDARHEAFAGPVNALCCCPHHVSVACVVRRAAVPCGRTCCAGPLASTNLLLPLPSAPTRHRCWRRRRAAAARRAAVHAPAAAGALCSWPAERGMVARAWRRVCSWLRCGRSVLLLLQPHAVVPLLAKASCLAPAADAHVLHICLQLPAWCMCTTSPRDSGCCSLCCSCRAATHSADAAAAAAAQQLALPSMCCRSTLTHQRCLRQPWARSCVCGGCRRRWQSPGLARASC